MERGRFVRGLPPLALGGRAGSVDAPRVLAAAIVATFPYLLLGESAFGAWCGLPINPPHTLTHSHTLIVTSIASHRIAPPSNQSPPCRAADGLDLRTNLSVDRWCVLCDEPGHGFVGFVGWRRGRRSGSSSGTWSWRRTGSKRARRRRRRRRNKRRSRCQNSRGGKGEGGRRATATARRPRLRQECQQHGRKEEDTAAAAAAAAAAATTTTATAPGTGSGRSRFRCRCRLCSPHRRRGAGEGHGSHMKIKLNANTRVGCAWRRGDM